MAMSGKLGGEGGCVRCALRSGCPASSADLGLLLRLPAMHASLIPAKSFYCNCLASALSQIDLH
eukprot:scaffold31954_cov15-Tisochrysis_lutea.AAC.1